MADGVAEAGDDEVGVAGDADDEDLAADDAQELGDDEAKGEGVGVDAAGETIGDAALDIGEADPVGLSENEDEVPAGVGVGVD